MAGDVLLSSAVFIDEHTGDTEVCCVHNQICIRLTSIWGRTDEQNNFIYTGQSL